VAAAGIDFKDDAPTFTVFAIGSGDGNVREG